MNYALFSVFLPVSANEGKGRIALKKKRQRIMPDIIIMLHIVVKNI